MLVYLPKEVACIPRSGECIVNHWWVVHPELGLLFYVTSLNNTPAPQCNAVENVARFVAGKLYPDCLIEYIPIVYISQVETYVFREDT